MISCLEDQQRPVVLDSSVAINIVGSKIPYIVVQAIPNQFLITESVLDEMRSGGRNGHTHADIIELLISQNHVQVVNLEGQSEREFSNLVIGPTNDTLEDGEAATLAYGLHHKSIPLTDDKKAVLIAKRRYPSLLVAHSIDIFAHPSLRKNISHQQLMDAVYNSLQQTRMRVMDHHLDWVKELLGPDRTSKCHSLPSALRRIDSA